MAAFNPWAGFGQQQFPPGFGGFGGVPQYSQMPLYPGQWGYGDPGNAAFRFEGGGPQPWLPDQGINQAPPPQRPPSGGPQLGGVGGAPVGGMDDGNLGRSSGPRYPDWFIQAGQQNGMNPRQMEVEWQRFMQNQGGGGRHPDMGGGGVRGGPQQLPPSGSGGGFFPEGYIHPDGRVEGPGGFMDGEIERRGRNGSVPIQGLKDRPQLGNIGGSPVSNFSSSGYLSGSGKSNAAPEGKAAGSGRWEYHANGSRTWRPNKPKPAAKPSQTTRPPVPVKPGPGGGPTPQPSPSANNDNVPSTSNKPPVANTPPIYVPGSEMHQSSGSMPSIAASLNKRRPGQ